MRLKALVLALAFALAMGAVGSVILLPASTLADDGKKPDCNGCN